MSFLIDKGFRQEMVNLIIITICLVAIGATCFPALSSAFVAFVAGAFFGLIVGISVACYNIARSSRRIATFLSENGYLGRFILGYLSQLGTTTPQPDLVQKQVAEERTVPFFYGKADLKKTESAKPEQTPVNEPPTDILPNVITDNPPLKKTDAPQILACISCGGKSTDFISDDNQNWHKICFAREGCYVCHKQVCNNHQKCHSSKGVSHYTCHQKWLGQQIECCFNSLHNEYVFMRCTTYDDLIQADAFMTVLANSGFHRKMLDSIRSKCPTKCTTSIHCLCKEACVMIESQIARRSTVPIPEQINTDKK